MDDRYSRQILFNPIGESGQNKIRNKHVLVVGCGALGTSNAEFLVRAGIGRLTLVDRDYVEWSNLQRQQLFIEEDARVQMPKAIAAKRALNRINSETEIAAHVMDANAQSLPPLLENVDLIMDASDNFDIRMVINDVSQKFNIPWIYGSCVGSTGMSYTIIPGVTPCLNCLMQGIPLSGATCDTAGIIPPAVGMVTSLQTAEALKILVEDHGALRKGLHTFDLWNNQFYTMEVTKSKRDNCPACGKNPEYSYLKYENMTKAAVLCGRNTVQIRTGGKEADLHRLEKQLSHMKKLNSNPYLLSFEYEEYRLVFFSDGRTLIHGTADIEKAKSIYYRLVG
ncbi:MoeB/ThiF family adenylyltransferase [Bacillus salacetis]|uniref:MoeB/ThiF family adenylyltransferase n=1 Tax=Bacillus salacetis TaxID=2315464 RepID=UPI003BA3629B